MAKKRVVAFRRSVSPAAVSPSQKFFLSLNPYGVHHNLMDRLAVVNARDFDNKIQAFITWSRRMPGRPRPHHRIHEGACVVEDRLVRIHPALDRCWVPTGYVEFVIRHELLHIMFPPIEDEKSGRTLFHHAQFMSAEEDFPDYEKWSDWGERNRGRILKF